MALRQALGLCLVVGCGSDGMPVDAHGGAPEVTPHPGSDIGDPCALTGGLCGDDMGTCTSPTDICIAPTCDELFVGGYCSQKCGSDNPTNPTCPSDATCVAYGQQASSLTHRCLRKCAGDADCRPGGYVCLPVIEGGKVCAPGLGCTAAPTSGLESPAFQHPNLRVPTDSAALFEAEGNCVSDAMGHVAMSQIAVYPGLGGDGMIVATYDAAGAVFGGMVSVFKDQSTSSVETSDPVLAYDRSGGNPAPLYLTWLEVGSTNPSVVYVAKSVDHGGTWSMPRAVSGADGARGNFLDKPWIAAAGGQVWVAWTIAGAIRFAHSSDGAATFGIPVTAARLNVANFAQVAAADSGDAYLSWAVSASPYAVHVARWDSQSSTFHDERLVPGSDRTVYDPVANGVSPDGRHFYVVFASGVFGVRTSILASASSDANGAFTMSAAVPINDHGECGVRIHPTVAVDAQGRGHVLWLDSYFTGGVARYSVSDPLGQTWSGPVVASDGPPWPFTVTRIPGLWLGDYVGIAVDADRVWIYYNGTQLGDRTHFFLTWRALEP